jgi:tryptophan synthase alpha subunit
VFSKYLSGFGVNSAGQVKALAPLVHAVVVGSYFTEVIQKAAAEDPSAIYAGVGKALAQLL